MVTTGIIDSSGIPNKANLTIIYKIKTVSEYIEQSLTVHRRTIYTATAMDSIVLEQSK